MANLDAESRVDPFALTWAIRLASAKRRNSTIRVRKAPDPVE